jgi:tetratricopeptide (TPR) repeat protein
MATPTPNRPLKRGRKPEKPRVRALTSKERRQKKTQKWVTWFLAFVFTVTSVGIVIGLRPQSQQAGRDTQSAKQQLEERLKALQSEATQHPDDPQWHYEQARVYLQMAQEGQGAGASDKSLQQAIEQYKATLKLDPSHLPALHDLAAYYLSPQQSKYKEAVDLLTNGINAEKEDLEKKNAQHRASKEPEIPPDATLRALLFQAYVMMTGHEKEAAQAARDALNINPSDFTMVLQRMSLQLMISKREETANQAFDIALREAQATQNMEAVSQILQIRAWLQKLTKAPSPAASTGAAPAVAPSGVPAGTAPATAPSGAPVGSESGALPAAPVSSGPASSPAASASGVPAPETTPASPAGPSPNP